MYACRGVSGVVFMQDACMQDANMNLLADCWSSTTIPGYLCDWIAGRDDGDEMMGMVEMDAVESGVWRCQGDGEGQVPVGVIWPRVCVC